MPLYSYRAVTKSGIVVRNKVEAQSRQTLLKRLKASELTPIDVKQLAYAGRKKTDKNKQRKNISDVEGVIKNVSTTNLKRTKTREMSTYEKLNVALMSSQKPTQRDLVVFTQNFYLLKKANFNNIHALSTIIQSTENISFRGILEDILAGLEAGEYMYTTMEYYSNVFPFIYINMVKVGELSGSLTNSLQQAVKYLDDTEALNKKLRSILIPNIAEFALLLVMLLVGTLFAIPAIQNVFDELGTEDELPAITIWFSGFVDDLMEYWYIPVAIIAAIVAAVIFYINTPRGKYNFDYFKYKMPVFGELIYSLDFSRLMKAMLLNLRNGMRIQDSLEVSKNVVQNYVMLSMIETSINNIVTGESWIEPFERARFKQSHDYRNAENRYANRFN